MRKSFGFLRLAVLTVGIVALIGDFQYILGFSSFATLNFFSYFTTQSAMIVDVVFAITAVSSFRSPEDPAWLGSVRAVATTYVIVSGIVFGLIISQASTRDYTIEVPWSSQLLHFWIPVYAVIDWLVAPGRRPVSWKVLRWVLVFPALWLAFTLIRGPVIGWYPYFFLDPAQVSGLAAQLAYLAGVGVAITAVGAFCVGTSRMREPSVRSRGERGQRGLTRLVKPRAEGTVEGSRGRS